ncbi:MAG: hypothetical protein UY18_C0017G0010 [Microgenomates group bacterium GW2011_GWF2_47_9]|nr:MAG: hypothetical protein UY18_C0017G0010 [Microgenomates group bacterium GW2011_GWF2_47_9]
MRLEVGQKIKTNYGTEHYVVVGIKRNCTCPHILDEINCTGVTESRMHSHLTVRSLKDGKLGWLNWYDDETLKSIRGRDRILLLTNNEPLQLSMI